MSDFKSLTKAELLVLVEEQAQMISLLLRQVQELKEEIERLKGGGSPTPAGKTEPPAWAKANTASPESKPRKPRKNAFVRPHEQPTEEIVHTCEQCPDCGRTLSGGSEYSRRQIIELPEITPRIVDHITKARYCGVCRKKCLPKVDFSEIAVGQSRFGQQVHALVAYLRQVARLPVRSIAALLSALCHLKVSVGEVAEMLSRVAACAQGTYAHLREQLRGSEWVHGDETGWRENGHNGYLWSFSTPSLCYFTYPKTRAAHVVTDVLGEDYPGILVSDFYAAYNAHFGLHQRCWVHLLRDVHDLKRKFPTPGVERWAASLHALYERARTFQSVDRKQRAQARVGFQAELVALACPYVETNLPQSTLCKRLLQYESELFTFVEYPQVPSENNAAERAIRPRVIARKISGGTRSPAGSRVMAVLSSLFATWQMRGEEGLGACRRMLRDAQKKPLDAPT